MLLPGTEGWTFISIFDIDGDSLSFGQSRCGTVWRIIKITSANCLGSTYEESMMWYPEQRYMLKVNGATMWIDSSIPDAARDGEFAMWPGRVYNAGGSIARFCSLDAISIKEITILDALAFMPLI